MIGNRVWDRPEPFSTITVGKLIDVQILDHVIIGSSGGYYSFRDSSSLIVI